MEIISVFFCGRLRDAALRFLRYLITVSLGIAWKLSYSNFTLLSLSKNKSVRGIWMFIVLWCVVAAAAAGAKTSEFIIDLKNIIYIQSGCRKTQSNRFNTSPTNYSGRYISARMPFMKNHNYPSDELFAIIYIKTYTECPKYIICLLETRTNINICYVWCETSAWPLVCSSDVYVCILPGIDVHRDCC